VAAGLRTGSVDRRRLTEPSRSQYSPASRLKALQTVQRYRAQQSYNRKAKPFATEQKPGSGGFQAGADVQAQRMFDEGTKKERAESFRPANDLKADVYQDLYS